MGRGDAAYLALLLSRALLLTAHTICARAARWVTNEKGLIAVADLQPGAPTEFADAVAAALGLVVSDPAAAVAAARAVLEQVRSTATAMSGR